MPPKYKRASTGSMSAFKRKRDVQAEESAALGEISGNSLSASRGGETSPFLKLSEARTSMNGTEAKKARTSAVAPPKTRPGARASAAVLPKTIPGTKPAANDRLKGFETTISDRFAVFERLLMRRDT